jgi:serine/threonine protein phosphatase PrpC
MADTDVFGLLALSLAAAGTAYIVWTRFSGRSQETSASDGGEPPVRADRTADTMPPTLRPHSEIPAKMAAKKVAMAKASGRPPPPEERTSGGAPTSMDKLAAGTRLSELTRAAAAVKSDPPKAQPTSGPAKAAPSSTKPLAPPMEGSIARVNSKRASAKTPVAQPVPSSVKTKTTKPVEAPSSSEERPVPRIEVEEDDDVEPTKVGRAPRGPIQPLVEKVVFDEGADVGPGPEAGPTLLIHAVAQTDTGKRRKQNEDSHLLLAAESVFIVADGMGGHRGGQVASKLAVKTMGDAFERKNFEAAPHKDIPIEASELARSVQMANTAIFNAAKKSADLEGMGTTLCAIRFTADKRRLYIAHVGDSRCYRVRNGVMRQMTSDHTMADYGVTGPEGAHLSRALGVWPTVPIDMVMATPELGDLYLLCSDGLTKMISDGTIATQLLHEEDPKAAVGRLVFFANSHGGKDNITVVLLRIVEPGWSPPRTTLPPPLSSATG